MLHYLIIVPGVLGRRFMDKKYLEKELDKVKKALNEIKKILKRNEHMYLQILGQKSLLEGLIKQEEKDNSKN